VTEHDHLDGHVGSIVPPHRFEDDLCRLLAHTIAHRRDAERPYPAVWLWDLHPANWCKSRLSTALKV
jgi:hypothetical protein